MDASSPAGSARPPTSATRIAARAGSPISPAINATSGPSSTHTWYRSSQKNISIAIESNSGPLLYNCGQEFKCDYTKHSDLGSRIPVDDGRHGRSAAGAKIQGAAAPRDSGNGIGGRDDGGRDSARRRVREAQPSGRRFWVPDRGNHRASSGRKTAGDLESRRRLPDRARPGPQRPQ